MSILNRAMRPLGVLLALVVCLSSATNVFAQSQASTGQIAGVVRDQAGAVIADATIKVTNVNTGFSQTVTTDSNGLYRFLLLPPGTYRVVVSGKGFADYTADGVKVEVGRTLDINARMTVGTLKEEVTVSAEMVEVTRHESSSFVNSTAIERLPINGRRFQDFVKLTPSAQTDPQRGQISLAGQRGINTNVNVDGLDYNQPFFGGLRGGERSNVAPTIPQDAIQEFQVVETGYSAEFGRSTGGLVTAITKTGTNVLHGSGYYFLRHKDLTPSTEFYDTIHNQLAAQGQNVDVKPAPTQHQWGGTIGGPIQADKLFYFGSYTQQRIRNPRLVFFDRLIGVTPNATTQEAYDYFQSLQTPFIQTTDAKAFLVRTDYQINNRNRLNVRYSYSDNQSENGTSTGNQLFPTITSALSNNGTEKDNIHTAVGQLASFFGRFANELRAQYTREERPRLANAQSPTVSNAIGAFGTVNFLGQNIESDWRFQVANNLTYQGGTHTAKLGFEWDHLGAEQLFGFNQNGALTFSSSSSTAQLLQIMSHTTTNRFDDTSVGYLRQIGNLEAAMSGEQIAGFLQDSWRLRPNLTINYGLRWEGSVNPQPQANNTNMINAVRGVLFPNGGMVDPTRFKDQMNQFAPRLGFAWDPFSDGKTAIRGFGGIYYAATPLLLYAGPVNNFRMPPGDLSIRLPLSVGSVPAGLPPTGNCDPVATRYWCNTVYKQLALIGVDLNNYTLGNLPILTAQQVQSVAQALGLTTFDPFRGVQPITMDLNYHNPRSYQAGAGVEREVASGWTVGADLNWIKTVYLQRNRELNLPRPVLRSLTADPAQRPYFGVASGASPQQSRPVTSLGSIQAREASAQSLYRGLTLKSMVNRKRYQINAYYTLSEALSDDDNERDAGGQSAVNTFAIADEYGFSRLDRKHQFVLAPVVFLPYDVTLSNATRMVSGSPVDATVGSDLNFDTINNDRPFAAPGIPFKRNAFRNRRVYDIDLRVQKGIRISESKKVYVSSEFFNLFNLMNLTYSGTTVTNYCSLVPSGTRLIGDVNCGLNGSTNARFLHLRDPQTGQLLTTNNPGTPFQVQFGVRFEF